MATFEYLDLLGKPFVRGGRGPDGFDCYGLAVELFARKGVIVPDFQSPGSLEEIESLVVAASSAWSRVAPKTYGSVVTFRVEGMGAHVGVMLDGDRFIHCIEPIGVAVERLTGNRLKPLAFYDYV